MRADVLVDALKDTAREEKLRGVSHKARSTKRPIGSPEKGSKGRERTQSLRRWASLVPASIQQREGQSVS